MSITGADVDEVAKFDAMADRWRDPAGPAAPLHRMNPLRLELIRDQLCAQFDRDPRAPSPLSGLRLLDVGCGGGLVTEPMRRLGAEVTGVDASEAAIRVARAHAAQAGLEIAYRRSTVEAVEGAFDAVLALEIVEHVPDPAAFLAALAARVAPGGLCLLTTLNRTPRSFAAAIIGAEWALRWLPRGTHDWRRFPTPEELAAHAQAAGLRVVDRVGMVYNPLSDRWRADPGDLSVNYLLAADRPAG